MSFAILQNNSHLQGDIMARWSKLDARNDYENSGCVSRSLPLKDTHLFVNDEDDDQIEFCDHVISEDIDDIDLEELTDSLPERLETLFYQFVQTRDGIYLLAIAKLFARVFGEEDHYYQDHCKSCYMFGIGAIRFCLMASIFDADSDDVDEILSSVSTHFHSQYDFQRICEREGKFITESIKEFGPEKFLKNLF